MEIKSLGDTSFDELFGAFTEAFADYEMQLDKEEMRIMYARRGFDPKLSFAAFDAGKIVSFTCNGIGDFYGRPTAYDTGTGTLKDYRGQGLATKVFEHSIPYLKRAGIVEYLLEVLQHNTGAVSVYGKIGFEVTREFYYFKAENRQIKSGAKSVILDYTLQAIDINDHKSIVDFWDFRPSWQNTLEAINRRHEEFICEGVFVDEQIVGYGVFDPTSGDVTQIAVDRDFRRRGVGSLLLHRMFNSNRHDSIKIINAEKDCNSMTAFLEAHNIEPTGKQFEMVKKL